MSLGDFPLDITSTPRRGLTGTLIPPMGKVVAFVRHAPLNDSDEQIETMRVATIAQALTKVVAGRNDIIVVLPGHAENITGADAWAALRTNTQIIGVGSGATRPTLTFTATTSQLILAAAGVTISGINFNGGGGVAVVLGIDVTAADVTFSGCSFLTAVAATNRFTTVMRLSAGAHRFTMEHCTMRGTGVTAADGSVDGIVVNAAVDRLTLRYNDFAFGTTVATVGLIRFATAAATQVSVYKNILYNTSTASAAVVDFDVAATGVFADNRLVQMAAAVPPAGGFVGTSAARFFENYVTGVVETSGYIAPVVDT